MKQMFFWNFLAFYMIQWMWAIWSLVPMPFLNPAGSSPFTYCLENFEHYFTSMWDECNCVIVWTFLPLPFFGIGMKTDLFPSCGHCWVFQICWYIECSTFTASSLRLWNSSTGIPSPSDEHSGLISFRMDWLDLLAVQDSRVFSNTTVQKHQFFSTPLSL